MSNNYVLLERVELSRAATSVVLDNLPTSGYTDLKLMVSARSTSTADWVGISFNGTTTGYSQKHLQGTGSSSVSFATSDYQFALINNQTGSTANVFSSSEVYIPNYRSSNFKSYSIDTTGEANATAAYTEINAQLWSNTSPITSITLTSTGGNLAAGSTFSLYGLAQVNTTPALAPKADGGNIVTNDGTYWYHAFLSNGTFTPQVGLTADVLMVGGGGGGGSTVGGGGGGGGLLYTTAQSLANATNYPVTVGAGGAGGVSDSNGVVGVNSTFNSLTALGGGYGGGYGTVGNDGGPGGSGGGAGNSGLANKTGGAGTAGQGTNGGSISLSLDGGAGGGGAINPGANNSVGTAGTGGMGSNNYSSWTIATGTGVSNFFAGGGGGGSNTSNFGYGAAGGGGDGGKQAPGNPGTVNTGGGGGGGGGNGSRVGGAGGSGIVIIRYSIA